MRSSANMTGGFRPAYITLTATLFTIAALVLLDPAVSVKMVKDDGIIQQMTVFFLCGCVLLALLHVIAKTPPVLKWAEAGYILCIYLMREMDFHRLFTAEHVTRLKFYKGPFPLEEKLIGGAIMLLFIAAMIHFCITNAPLFAKGLKNKIPRAWYVIVWGCLLFGAQIVDKPRLFRGLFKTLAEESMEMGAAIMMLFILLTFPLNFKHLLQRRSL
jgi:hypothetical protein